uniref:LYK3/RLK10-like LysM domain-containing protein n=1 Tax=Oryza brachyantha TaxID=4533 RepID=J3MZ40_ORYBR
MKDKLIKTQLWYIKKYRGNTYFISGGGWAVTLQPRRLMLSLLVLLVLLVGGCAAAASSGDGCRAGCPLALAAYYFSEWSNLTFIASIFGIGDYQELLPYNPAITNPDYVVTGDRVYVPFPCSCLALPAVPSSTFLAGAIPYPLSRGGGDTYDAVAAIYANLTNAAWLNATSSYPPNRIPPGAGKFKVAVNCSCGDERVSRRYGLFLTYPLWDGETLASAAARYGFSSPEQVELIRSYNPRMEGASGKGIVFIPVKDPSGSYHPLKSGVGIDSLLRAFVYRMLRISRSKLHGTLIFNSCSSMWNRE